MNQLIRLTVILFVGLSTAGGTAFGRGFGGGGFHGGGFGGGGFGGGYHGGGFDGGYRGGFDGGGFRSDGFENRSFDNRGFDSRGFDDGGFRSDGFAGQGFRAGNFDAGRYGQAPSRNQVDSFLGLPTDGGMHAAGERIAGGTAVEGPRGNVAARGFEAGRGVAVGPGGVAAGRGVVAGRGFAGTHYFSPTYFHAQGVNARRWYGNHPYFTAGWVGNHPWAWTPFGYGAGAWASAAWAAASWSNVGLWLGMSASPAYYYYGSNVVYDDGSVYYGDQPMATTDEYYQQASDLAGAGASVPSDDPNWLPLGVFGVVEGNQQQPSSTMQLAVDKQGNVRGNFVDDKSETVLPIQGAVNKKSQRVAWTVGDDKTTVYETGLSNLTEAEAPALVHYGRESTQQCLLVRLTQPDPAQAPQPQQN